MGRWDSTPTGDRPRSGQGDEIRASHGTTGLDEATSQAAPFFTNPQSQTPGWDQERTKRFHWIRSEIGDQAGNGQMPDDSDFAQLPAAVRGQAKSFCRVAVETFKTGEQERAREIARLGCMDVASALPSTWHPPTAAPSSELLDEIRGGIR